MTINDIGYLEGYMSKVALGPAGAAVADLAVAGGSRAATGLGKIMLPLALATHTGKGKAGREGKERAGKEKGKHNKWSRTNPSHINHLRMKLP
jgi:hypothetical protein